MSLSAPVGEGRHVLPSNAHGRGILNTVILPVDAAHAGLPNCERGEKELGDDPAGTLVMPPEPAAIVKVAVHDRRSTLPPAARRLAVRRALTRRLLASQRKHRDLPRTLIVGACDAGNSLLRGLRARGEYVIAGFVDDPVKQDIPS
jgi:hypothetical protein